MFYFGVLLLASVTTVRLDNVGRDTTTCPNPGLQCSDDCTAINYCPEMGGNPIKLRTCEGKLLCSNSTGIPECDAYVCHLQGPPPPICGVSGSIPSPYNCTQFFICTQPIDENPKEFSCPIGLTFDATNGICNTIDSCYDPKTCKNPGDFGIIDNTDIFCYYCNDDNRPLVIKCADYPSLTKPTDSPTKPTPSQPTMPPTSAGTSQPTETSFEPSQPTESSSLEPSQPTESSSLEPSQPTDSSSLEPSQPTESSSLEPSPPTESSSLEPSQPTDSSSLEPSQPTESSSQPSQPTDATPTTSPPSMQCSAIGQKFPDPARCNAYWLCTSKSGPPEYRQCPKNYSYDTLKQICVNKPC